MSILVKSLKRLYDSGKITKEQLKERVEIKTISADEYEFITGEKHNERTADELT